ncbi:MAG: ferredoxin:thioredoxin reductase [Desulfovibrio sp. S3730MH75]|nr:MAG: ferredoxin:thioredoxin reductase [Desulfovibrio sp. S3730MH75]
MNQSEENLKLILNYVEKNCVRTGLQTHPMPEVTEAVVGGLTNHLNVLKRPLCPCQFYPNKQEAVQERTWLCPCDDMKKYKYCHCLLFVNSEGNPITEYLPNDHDGLTTYGLVSDPAPEKGRKGQHMPAEIKTAETVSHDSGGM